MDPLPAAFADDPALPQLLECDQKLVAIGRKIRVLKAIEWPVALEERFLETWRDTLASLTLPLRDARIEPAVVAQTDGGKPGVQWQTARTPQG